MDPTAAFVVSQKIDRNHSKKNPGIDKEKPIEENYEILNEYIASIMPGHRVIRLPKTYLSNIRSNSVLVLKNIEDDKLQYITIDENFKIEYLEFVNSNSYNMSLQ